MLERELEEASRMAREAGAILLSLYGTDVEVQLKDRADPVTEADHRANEFIVARLRAAFPDDGIVAEETADQSEALHKARCWYVDPLDGTKEFLARNGEFSVMIGLAIDGRSRLGVVYQPVHDKLYCGVVGGGASLEENGARKALTVSDVHDPSALRLVVSRSHRSESTDRVVTRLGIRNEICSGSVGLKVGIIAEQRADLYVHLSGKSSKWDACGPEAVLTAAGGRFFDLAGHPIRYDEKEMKNRGGILACNAAAYDRVLPVVKEVAESAGLV